MSFMATIKAEMALRAHNKGEIEKAKGLYCEALDKGLMSARPMLGYAMLLLREGRYQESMELLLKTQKAPDLTPERKSQLYIYYAACCARTGQLEKGVRLLERQHDRAPTGLTYQTLGYLYVELYEAGRKPVATEETVVHQTVEDPVPGEETPVLEGLTVEEKQAVLDEQWQLGIEKAKKLIEASIDYDEEDPVCLDNMGQFYYRVLGDRAQAKEWFEKAHKEKPEQIDSLWFLSRYDVEAGDKAAAVEKIQAALKGRFSPLNYATKEMLEAELAKLTH